MGDHERSRAAQTVKAGDKAATVIFWAVAAVMALSAVVSIVGTASLPDIPRAWWVVIVVMVVVIGALLVLGFRQCARFLRGEDKAGP